MSETFQEYSARLMSLSAGKDGLAVLASTPSRLEALLAGHSEAELRWTPTPRRWSIAEIVAHLGDAEIVGAYRIRAILASPGISLQAYDQNDWMRAQRHESSDPHVSLALFAALRAAQVRLLRGLDDEEPIDSGRTRNAGRERSAADRLCRPRPESSQPGRTVAGRKRVAMNGAGADHESRSATIGSTFIARRAGR